MTTKNNTKKFLSIIVIAIIGSMLFIACKAKPTDLNNYQVEEPAVNPTNPETPNPTNENSQKVEVKIDNNNDLRQFGEGTRENFKGYHYVSKEYMINGKLYKFTATIVGILISIIYNLKTAISFIKELDLLVKALIIN